MRTWLIIGGILLLVVLLLAFPAIHEGFADLDTVSAQRQALQFEGERRYNDLARIQASRASLDPGLVDAAISQVVPTATTASDSLRTLIATAVGLGAADNGTDKSGKPVEQTGTLQQKIAFCESMTTVDCAKLDDPRAAECGFCSAKGVNSQGKAWRGGLFISSDDQIRKTGIPTVGTCSQKNFTLTRDACRAREAQIGCEIAGGPTKANNCGSCYGSAGSLLVVDKKNMQYDAILWISHPGRHGGTTITYGVAGNKISLPPSTTHLLLDPQQIPIKLTEGDPLSIQIDGVPMIWCGWLSNADGTRTVSLDIGEQSISPVDGLMIVGDSASKVVAAAVAEYDSDVWASFGSKVPRTTLWYGRRDEVVPPAISTAWYGVTLPAADGTGAGVWVSVAVQALAAAGNGIPVSPTSFGVADPVPGSTKHLWIWVDRGAPLVAADGQTIDASRVQSIATIIGLVPATLKGPYLRTDLPQCPSGPMVFTEVGAGIMGSHSCFKPDGSFNPTQYCLQELFQAAGGTPQGVDFPNSDEKAKALVVNNSLDDTVAALNMRANIALYGVDSNGAPVDFATFKDASLRMFGRVPANPCDGPNAQTGPHTPECLDFLWRTSGDSVDPDLSQTDPTALPFEYCGREGLAAPLNPDGSINGANVVAANSYGSVPAIRSFFKSIYDRSRDSSNFDAQAAAMRNCYNTNIQPPPEQPSACPPPNPTEFQCFPPSKMQQPEVFNVCPNGGYTVGSSEAEGTCATYGARVAEPEEIAQAQRAGADWCACGWAADGNAYYPMNTILPQYGGGCGSVGVNSCGQMTAWGDGKACVACYGIKPPAGTQDIRSFTSSGTWYQPQAGTVSDNWVPACKEVANQVLCLSQDGVNPVGFPSNDACEAWLSNPQSVPQYNKTMPIASQNGTFSTIVDQYIRARV